LHSTKWSDGKKKKEWKTFCPPQNNLIQDSEGIRRVDISNNKKDITFLLVEIRKAIQKGS
jgi:hypothetical protein